jgi:hypothetical protein
LKLVDALLGKLTILAVRYAPSAFSRKKIKTNF